MCSIKIDGINLFFNRKRTSVEEYELREVSIVSRETVVVHLHSRGGGSLRASEHFMTLRRMQIHQGRAYPAKLLL